MSDSFVLSFIKLAPFIFTLIAVFIFSFMAHKYSKDMKFALDSMRLNEKRNGVHFLSDIKAYNTARAACIVYTTLAWLFSIFGYLTYQ